jgi:hypothetical protein
MSRYTNSLFRKPRQSFDALKDQGLIKVSFPGMCWLCGMPVYAGDLIEVLPATALRPQVAQHEQCGAGLKKWEEQ